MCFVTAWILVGMLLGFSLNINTQNLDCNQVDMKALLGFYSELDSNSRVILSWDVNSSSPNCCNWAGITCSFLELNNSAGRVVSFEVMHENLIGKLPESLANMEHLRKLNLSGNFLSGSLPRKLLNLPDLEVLDLSMNRFSGDFPMSMSLPLLKIFSISKNHFQGAVPVRICSNSTKLEALQMGRNSFTGNVAPGLGNCGFLKELSLESNFLSGALPVDMFLLSKLAVLSLQDNRFSGNLSDNIGNLSSLVQFYVSNNRFSGNLPDSFYTLKKLNYFSAESNQLMGNIPRSLANSRGLVYLNLRNNTLSGKMDLNCSAMVSLASLNFGRNQLNGSISDNLSDCPRLKAISLGRNHLNGQVPESFKAFQTLSYLTLSENSIHNLSAALEILQHCRNLTTLILTRNFYDEEFPSQLDLHFPKLEVLVIAYCSLTGTFPLWLAGLKNLKLLDISWNQLHGEIPPWIGDFPLLFYLDLSNNSFSGEMPKELAQLHTLISGENSSGEPVPYFPLVTRGYLNPVGLQYNKIRSLPPTLQLRNNSLTGQISPHFGNLKELHVLDLKWNHLSGSIPNNFSSMTNLEVLDLSHNDLTGKLPPSLVNLSFLSTFSVAYNKLSGVIPSAGQFVTFPGSSFEGNQGLCGIQLSLPCRDDRNSHRDFQASHKRKASLSRRSVIILAVCVGLGNICVLAFFFFIAHKAATTQNAEGSH